MTTLMEDLDDLETAEAFLDYFKIPYERHVLDVCRLHILQRAHDYLNDADLQGSDDETLYAAFAAGLAKAYDDFVGSHPLKERVFKVLKEAPDDHPPQQDRTFVPLGAVLGVTPERPR